MSKRNEKKDLKEFLNPSKLTIDDALNSENPVYEVARRLDHLPQEKLSGVQRNFEGIFCLFGDTLNGGFLSSLANSSGDYFHETESFTESYCSPQLAKVMESVRGMFPDGQIPKDRNRREELIEKLTNNYEVDPFDETTSEFCDLEPEFCQGLLDYLKEHKNEFANIVEAE
jgi:hypothetical protein